MGSFLDPLEGVMSADGFILAQRPVLGFQPPELCDNEFECLKLLIFANLL